jgi:UDP-N-acetylmuramate dehydrogenase
LPGAEKNVLLKNYTTYKIGGPAEYFFIARTREDLITALKIAKKLKLAVYVIGGGSNVLVSDKGVRGLVIKIDILGTELKNNEVFVGAGANLT